MNNNNGAAVVIVHGSSGIDSRGMLHSKTLNDAGFTTLELDLWAARGWQGNSFGRPKGDAFAAFSYLAELDGVDSKRIGLMGFSWGGVVTMLSRNKAISESYIGKQKFSASVAFYPVCWVYNKVPGYELQNVNESPLLILTGADDDYDTPTSCQSWKESLTLKNQRNVEVVVYKDAVHAFNTSDKAIEVVDPFSHLGKGGTVKMHGNSQAREAADKKLLTFFSETIGTRND